MLSLSKPQVDSNITRVVCGGGLMPCNLNGKWLSSHIYIIHNVILSCAGIKPKMKNHYRAHQLSVWLRLVPELHRAGMEDVEPRHNLFRGHADPSLYDGSVRADPLSRLQEPFSRGGARSNLTTETPTTVDYTITTCVSVIQSTNLQNVHNASSDTLASLDAAG